MAEYRILITTSGAKGVPALIRDLRCSGNTFYMVAADMDAEAVGNLFAEKSYVVPAWTDKEYIPSLLRIVEHEKIGYILTNDGPAGLFKLCELTKQRPDLKISVSKNLAHLQIAADKARLFDFLSQTDLAPILPHYKKVRTKTELIRTIIDFGYLAMPVAVKPAQAEGSRGFRIIREQRENIFEKKFDSAGLSMAELESALTNIEILPEILVMEYLPGQEYSVDALVDASGRLQYAVPRVRTEINEGLAVGALVERNDELVDIVGRILNKLELLYALNFQFKFDASGRPKLLEINPRIGGTMTCCTGAGANIHYHVLLALAGQTIPPVEIKYGTKMFRFYDEKYIYP